MFNEYNPLEDKIYQILGKEGKLVNEKEAPELDMDLLLSAYKKMLYARLADQSMVQYQRQGRLYNFPPATGQEAVGTAFGMVSKKKDWLVPTYRELPSILAKGASIKDLYLNFMGDEAGYLYKGTEHIIPMSIPIGSQLPHAVGIGYEIKYHKKDEVVFAYVGDGGTSQGDFHEALNYAGVWKVPVVFIVQNNQYAISTHYRKQTASVNFAIKSLAYGIKGIKADGNDFPAMYNVLKYAADYARQGNGPVLVEAFTYRKGPHTTSDDPSKYRTNEEEKDWEMKDPLKRMKTFLIGKKSWSEKEDKDLNDQYLYELDRLFEEVEKHRSYQYDDVFDHLYNDPPKDLLQQKASYADFLKQKEAGK